MTPILSFRGKAKKNAAASMTTGYGHAAGTACHGTPGYWPEGLRELSALLADYDRARRVLEEEGGDIATAKGLTSLLNQKVSVFGPYGEARVTLSQPDQLRASLATCGQYDIKFNIRRLDHGLPVYYVARIHRDWWGLYSLIVEDIHMSPGYPLLDRRFARIMVMGKERYYLRLSLFREAVTTLFPHAGADLGMRKDTFLYELGRCIFQGAWHTDQRFTVLFSEVFELPRLRNAVELVYLCLSCDLSALRRFLTPEMHAFFDVCHPNNQIARLLERLEGMNATDMGAIKQRALEAYQRLAADINEAFTTQIPWSNSWIGPMPLWKIVVANVSRLHTVRTQIGHEPTLQHGIKCLNEAAAECIDLVLEEQS